MAVLDLEVKMYMRQRHPGRSTFESRKEEPQIATECALDMISDEEMTLLFVFRPDCLVKSLPVLCPALTVPV